MGSIILAYIFGEEILKVLHVVKEYWFIVLPLGAAAAVALYYYFHRVTSK